MYIVYEFKTHRFQIEQKQNIQSPRVNRKTYNYTKLIVPNLSHIL